MALTRDAQLTWQADTNRPGPGHSAQRRRAPALGRTWVALAVTCMACAEAPDGSEAFDYSTLDAAPVVMEKDAGLPPIEPGEVIAPYDAGAPIVPVIPQ